MLEERTLINPSNFPADGIIRSTKPVSLWGLKGYTIKEISISVGHRKTDKHFPVLSDSECDGMIIEKVQTFGSPDQTSKESWMATDYQGIRLNSPDAIIKYAYAEGLHIPLQILGENSQCEELLTFNTSGDGFQLCANGSRLHEAQINGLLDIYPYEVDHSDVGMMFATRGSKVLKDAHASSVRLHKSGHKWEHQKPQGILGPDDSYENCSVTDCELYGVHKDHGVRFGHAVGCIVRNVRTDGAIAFGDRKNKQRKGRDNYVSASCQAPRVDFEDNSQAKQNNKEEIAMVDREPFFNHIRQTLFGGTLEQSQVDGINAILDAWDNETSIIGYKADRADWIAYSLATVFHETGFTMRPIKERGGNAYFKRMYDICGDNPELAKRLGNVNEGDGIKYCGHGLPQLTGLANYLFQGKKHGIDLVGNPELMLDMQISAKVLVSGMIDGDFTGKAFEDCYDNTGLFDPVQARRIINGFIKGKANAKKIAEYHDEFLAGLTLYEDPENDQISTEPTTIIPKKFDELVDSYARNETSSAQETKPMNEYDPRNDGPITLEPKQGISAKMNSWFSGKKTHLGMIISGGIGLAGMLGYVPGLTAEAGAQMLQSSFAISGTRSAIPSLMKMGINLYLKQR